MSINKYILSIREAIERLDVYGFAESIDIREEIRAGKQAVIKTQTEDLFLDMITQPTARFLDFRIINTFQMEIL